MGAQDVLEFELVDGDNVGEGANGARAVRGPATGAGGQRGANRGGDGMREQLVEQMAAMSAQLGELSNRLDKLE